jgi:hypothetical protein
MSLIVPYNQSLWPSIVTPKAWNRNLVYESFLEEKLEQLGHKISKLCYCESCRSLSFILLWGMLLFWLTTLN